MITGHALVATLHMKKFTSGFLCPQPSVFFSFLQIEIYYAQVIDRNVSQLIRSFAGFVPCCEDILMGVELQYLGD